MGMHDTEYTDVDNDDLIEIEEKLQNSIEKQLNKKGVSNLRKLEEVQRELTLREAGV